MFGWLGGFIGTVFSWLWCMKCMVIALGIYFIERFADGVGYNSPMFEQVIAWPFKVHRGFGLFVYIAFMDGFLKWMRWA